MNGMNRGWTFGQKLALGYAVLVAFSVLIGITATLALRTAVAAKDEVIGIHTQLLLDAQRLNTNSERRTAALRGFVITRDPRHLDSLATARNEFATILARLRSATTAPEDRQILNQIDQASTAYREVGDQFIAQLRQPNAVEIDEHLFDERIQGPREALAARLREYVAQEEQRAEQARRESSEAASAAMWWLGVFVAGAVVAAVVLAILLTRMLNRQIGTVVGHVQSSSTELQSAATQQASGAKEQATAMNEIATTISELVATSRQIAESAQNVAQIATQTAAAARHGEVTVDKGQEAVADIRRQVDQVVNHMLELGKKSQEIGSVLDIVSELAEQTNILAINATIEASGAGEAGRRFAVVADEIRKLADRVAHATKEIRALIEDVRGAVNTTVMATEGSAKAVDAGSRQFTEVATAFKQIAEMVVTTTDAAREIELSTRQQATAAEQVRTAVADVAQTTREGEASTTQTLQTASQLAGLSRDLQRLILSQAS
jgi:methyl-accepting chemotaxis protein